MGMPNTSKPGDTQKPFWDSQARPADTMALCRARQAKKMPSAKP